MAGSNYPKWLTLHEGDSGKKLCHKKRKTVCRRKIWGSENRTQIHLLSKNRKICCFFSDMKYHMSHLSSVQCGPPSDAFCVVKSKMIIDKFLIIFMGRGKRPFFRIFFTITFNGNFIVNITIFILQMLTLVACFYLRMQGRLWVESSWMRIQNGKLGLVVAERCTSALLDKSKTKLHRNTCPQLRNCNIKLRPKPCQIKPEDFIFLNSCHKQQNCKKGRNLQKQKCLKIAHLYSTFVAI